VIGRAAGRTRGGSERHSGSRGRRRGWSKPKVIAFNPQGIILAGGPESVTGGESSPRAANAVFALGVPVLDRVDRNR